MRTTSIPLLTAKPVPVIGTGAMPLSHRRPDGSLMPLDEAVAVLHHAFDQGLTLVDTADIYAPSATDFGHNERLVGEAVRTWSGGRDAVVVVTKIGITRHVDAAGKEAFGRDASREYLLRAAEASAERLGLVPDVVVNHRVDRSRPFAEAVRGMLAVQDAGLAGAVGVGNVDDAEIEVAWEVGEGRIAAIENERSPRYREHDGVLSGAVSRGAALLCWSPLGGGADAGRLGALHPEFASVAAEIGEVAGGPVTAQEVALAWLAAQGPTVVPIPGFTRFATADSAARAGDLVLTPDQVTRLDASPRGDRSVYPD